MLERTEPAIRLGAEVTIRTLWMHLADRYASDADVDLCAAAALAGMAVGVD